MWRMSQPAFAKWMIWSVLLSLSPFVLELLSLLTMSAQGASLRWSAPIERGQLLLVCAGLGATGVGDLIGTSDRALSMKRYAGGSSVLIVLLAAGYYATASSPAVQNREIVVGVSVMLYLLTLVVSFACISLAEEAE
jgi:hypothetical protein